MFGYDTRISMDDEYDEHEAAGDGPPLKEKLKTTGAG